MAAAAGVSKSTVQLVWHAHGLKPHRVQTFKLSNYARFEKKLVEMPKDLAIRLILDNYATHEHQDGSRWLDNPRFHLHFTPRLHPE